MEEEIWKDIQGFEGYYQVSSSGSVRSLDRYDNRHHFRRGRILIPVINTDGYPTVHLHKNGKSHSVTVHRLVAASFLVLPDDSNIYEVNHIDCNKRNNAVSNLEYVTHLRNVQHAIENGVHGCLRDLSGENNPNYGRHTLHERYKQNPELAFSISSQPGAKNGNARAVTAKINGEILSFGYVGECAQYLIDNGLTDGYLPTVRAYIAASARKQQPYLGIQFNYL